MKGYKLLFMAAAILAAVNLYGQGAPYGTMTFGILGATPEDRIYVNTSGVVGDGVEVPVGTAYMAALYWGPAGAATDANFIQSGNPVGFGPPGQFGGGTRTISPLPEYGAVVSVQVRGWSTVGQTEIPSTYEQALVLGTEVGKSAWFDMRTRNPQDSLFGPILGWQAGWSGFAITPVPEPSVIGVGLLGVGAALKLRRCKR